jgi:hypothetical protein
MNRLSSDVSIKDAIIKMCDGNPGALKVLLQLVKRHEFGFVDLFRLDDAEIYGSRIWICYKDIYGHDINVLSDAILNHTIKKQLQDWEKQHVT